MVTKRRRYAIIDRPKYILALVSIPGVKGCELVKAAEFRLPELFPGDISTCRWDYRRLKSSSREQLLIAIIPDACETQSGLYIPLFHAVDLRLHRHPEGITLNESGITDVLGSRPDGGYTLRQLPEPEGTDTVASLTRRGGYRGAFKMRHPGGAKLGLALSLALTLSALVVWSIVVIQEHRQELSELSTLRHERTVRMEELVTLEEHLSAAPSGNSAQPAGISILHLLHLLSEVLPAGSELIQIDYTPLKTNLELTGPDALKAAERIDSLDGLNAGLSGDIRPLADGSKLELYRLELETDE